MDKIAITHSMALTMAQNEGLINNFDFKGSAERVYKDMLSNLKQPTKGYFYADSVSNFIKSRLSSANYFTKQDETLLKELGL
jgi:hypothetical protein